jgi:hypothetical protein
MARQLSAIRPDGVEIDANAFHAQDELGRVLIPRPARRIHAAFAARECGETQYLEPGMVGT